MPFTTGANTTRNAPSLKSLVTKTTATAKTSAPLTTKTQTNALAAPNVKCATVTMMLAERIARNDWSVDDEHFFETNNMNVWQTIEFLSSISLRKRYHYEGYNDTENVIQTLVPSWRRDGFVEKNPQAEEAAAAAAAATNNKNKYAAAPTDAANNGNDMNAGGGGGGSANDVADNVPGTRANSGAAKRATSASANMWRENVNKITNMRAVAKNVRRAVSAIPKAKRRNRSRGRGKQPKVPLDPEYALSPSDYTDLVKCNFNFPRISARLERLMGTNIVRLTDNKYMKELRNRIDNDYIEELMKRIKARELKEIERERLLILEGKCDVIPDELINDPIFLVNKVANIEIQKTRAKLKTNREKNAERLKQQGAKWERERLVHEEEERQRLQIVRERRKAQKLLEQKYKEEDEVRGMDLLRIDNEDWRECEQKLKEFLEQERAKMKARSLKVPTPFTTDPLDIQNVMRAKQKFRETQKRIQDELEQKAITEAEVQMKQKHVAVAAEITEGESAQLTDEQRLMQAAAKAGDDFLAEHADDTVEEMIYLYMEGDKEPQPFEDQGDDMTLIPIRHYSDDASDDDAVISDVEKSEGSTISAAKARHAYILQEELEEDVQRGLLISREQYEHLRFEDIKILQLRNAEDMRKLYQLAEEIIIGDKIVEEPVEEEEQVPDFEEEGIEEDDDDDDYYD